MDYDLRPYDDTDSTTYLPPFVGGRFTDNCERGRANNAACVAKQRVAAGLVRAAYLTAYDDGRLLTLQLPSFGASEPPTPGTRGKVNGLSDESRRRLMMLLHSLKRSASAPAFVTLTFPDDAIPSPELAKAKLAALFKRWRRRSGLSAVWRIEAHPLRSETMGFPVPHFHLLVWGGWIDRFELSNDWAEVVNAPNIEAHRAAGTKVETIRSFRGVCSYAAKYISKVSPVSLGDDAGRVWGIFNRDGLPVADSRTIKLTPRQTVLLVRAVKNLLRARGVETEYLPTAIFCDDPRAFVRVIDE